MCSFLKGLNPIFDESPPVDPTSDESPTADFTFDESSLSAPTVNPVNTTAPEPCHSHLIFVTFTTFLPLVPYMNLTPFVRPPLTLYGSKL
uniref:Uncharacterized protein n=1 Tax=Fagus sylvatica TaxID=28930 RepID=A0A2N9IRT7_FAGSY